MSVFAIVIPLMVLGVVIATVPVLAGSIRHHRDMREGQIETQESAQAEADFWHRMLGRRRGRRVVPTPERVSDREVTRAGARTEDRRDVDGDSVWITPR
jgi:hypothetical protein